MKTPIALLFFFLLLAQARAALFIPMDEAQTDHLRAYGIAYAALQKKHIVHWLLYYRGGSFLIPQGEDLLPKAIEWGVYAEQRGNSFLQTLTQEKELGMIGDVRLEKAPKIGVYVPPHNLPWDDAVTLALTYAHIPFDKLWDDDFIQKKTLDYDFIHLHHEDFTGQFGRFYLGFSNAPWYQKQVADSRAMAHKLGFKKVSQLKGAVARRIRQLVEEGKVLFAMCSAPDSLDTALAAAGLDIVPREIDGDDTTPEAIQHLNYGATFAFINFRAYLSLDTREVADIDLSPSQNLIENPGVDFQLHPFSPLLDPVPAMLVQNHTPTIPDFLGLTSYFNRDKIKQDVLILGEIEGTNKVKYIHGIRGQGAFTFLAGHDPEDYAHLVGEEPTELRFHKHSPGYRLILNNVLYPASRKKKLKT